MILDNLKQIRYRISSAAKRSGRDPELVGLVVVTKYATPQQIREAIATGLVSEVGESRIQAVQARKLELGGSAAQVRWRLIGHLQTNKATKAVELFDAVDSLDAPRTAQALEKALAALGRRLHPADFLADRVARGAQLLGLLQDVAPLLIQIDDAVQGGG